MEKIEFIPAARHSLLKWAAAALAAVIVLSAGIGIWVGAMTSTPSTTDKPLADSDQISQINTMNSTIAEKDLVINEQNDTIAALTDENAALTDENTTLTGENASLTDQNTVLTAEVDSLQQQLDAYEEKYGTEHYVVFEIRRHGLIEECLSVTALVSANAYGQFQIGAEVANPEPYLSIPSDWLGVNWSITVLNKYQAQAETV